MSAITKIEWTDRTWGPVRGCSVISPGCVNCYAMKQAHRFSGPGKAYEGLTKQTSAGPQWTGVVRTVESALLEPLSWREKREPCFPCMGIDGEPCPACGGRGYHTRGLRIFVNSMSDLFHDGVDNDFIARVFAVMALSHWHTFQILTKRPERMRQLLDDYDFRGEVEVWISMMLEDEDRPPALRWDALDRRTDDARATSLEVCGDDWPLPNVWLGVSVEDQKHADERIPLLEQTPAAVRFLSVEPMLGPIDLRLNDDASHLWNGSFEQTSAAMVRARKRAQSIHWVIAGGESGNGARPCALEWLESIVQQCQTAHVPPFVKQLGAYVVSEHRTAPADMMGPNQPAWNKATNGEYFAWRAGLADRKGGDLSEFPELNVRQFPETRG